MTRTHRDREDLLTIGDFARAAGLTPKALRLYDDLGLLRPTEVDERSGYRRYAPAQLEHARLVATLRLVGMPLARIQQVLDGPRAAAAGAVEAYWVQVEADTATRRDVVTALVRHLRNEEPTMTTSTSTLHATFGTSHRQGRRERQQDAFVATPDLVAVADGFGERDDLAGAVLSAFAAGGLEGATAEVGAEISAGLPDAPSSGTTLTAVTLDGATARITHVGDGRVWLVRDGALRQVTHDHTVVAALLESGQLTPGVVVDETSLDLRPGDRLVLTTDGVHSVVDDLAPLLLAAAAPQAVADTVASAVVAAEEPDNHTIGVVDLS